MKEKKFFFDNNRGLYLINRFYLFIVSLLIIINIFPSYIAESSNNIFSSKPHILFLLTICIVIIIVIILLIQLFVPNEILVQSEIEEPTVEEEIISVPKTPSVKFSPPDYIFLNDLPQPRCKSCNRYFKPLKTAYMCSCGTFLHYKCSKTLHLCPQCGKFIDETQKPTSIRPNTTTRTKIRIEFDERFTIDKRKSKFPEKGKEFKILDKKEDFSKPSKIIDKTLDESTSFKSTVKPNTFKLDMAKRCDICLGLVKPGLTIIKCPCGKHYHLTCAYRVGECPNCDAKFDKQFLKKKMIDEKGFEDELRETSKAEEMIPKKDLQYVLKERMVKGEIEIEQYREMKRELE